MGLLSASLVIFLGAAYVRMERSLMESGRTRAKDAADRIVSMLAPAAQQRALEMERVAADEVLRESLRSPSDLMRTAAKDRVRALVANGRQTIEVWSAGGDRQFLIAIPATVSDTFPPSVPPTDAGLRFTRGNSGIIVSDTVETIVSGSANEAAVLGYLVVRRPVAASPPDALDKLVGDGARVRMGSANGNWTDLRSIVEPSRVDRAGVGVTEYISDDGEARVAAVGRIDGTPWLISVGFPQSVFLAPARSFLYQTSLVALGLIVISGLLTRRISTSITNPLATLTDATEAIAAGDYAKRVVPHRSDELGRLASAFNSMASQVQDAHEHLTLAVQGSNVGIWEWHGDGDRVYLSAQWKQLLGYAEREIEGSRSLVRELVHPDDWGSVSSGIRACLDGEIDGWESEHRLRRKDGSYIWVLARGKVTKADGGAKRLAGTSIDITAQKTARDEAVLQSRQVAFVADVAVAMTEGGELRDMLARCAQAMIEHLDATVARVWTTSLAEPTLELAASAGLESDAGQALAKVPIGSFAIGRVAAERHPIIDNAVDPRRFATEEIVRAEHLQSYAAFPLVLGDRVVGVLSMFGRKPLTAGTLISLGSVARTVALGIEHKQQGEMRARFENLLESATDLVTIGRLVGPPLYVNRAAREALGIGRDEQVPSLFAFRPPQFRQHFEETVMDSVCRDGMWKGQTEYVSRSGRSIPVSQVSIAHKNPAGVIEYLSTISRDISDELRTAKERDSLEDQLRRAQRLEAIGQLAGGLAHDFNNLLTVILGYTNVLNDEFPDGHPRHEDLEQIRRAGDRASQLTRQLLAFSRKQILNPVVLDLNGVIEEMRPMINRLMGESIDVVVKSQAEIRPVKCDPTQIELILVNLAVNARDAMPQGGALTIETSDIELDGEFCRTHLSMEPGHYVRLSVTDTGVGIDDETKKRIFEPFFTTKGRDKGTGLGLATVFGIVRQSGGSVWVDSEQGLGASFKIFLPATSGAKALPLVRAARTAPTGSETILVVEDEPGVRGLVETVLRRSGYTVLVAARPIEAIRMAGDHKHIDLLLTDVVMPDMNGAALSRELTKTRSALRVLFMSGFADEIIEHNGVLPTDIAFLQKPFTPASLARKVRQVLDHQTEFALVQ